MDSGIYRLDFSNGQFYIGKSENIPKRWKAHQLDFEKGTHTKRMQAVYNLYGAPHYSVIASIHADHIDVYEGIFIQKCWGPNLLNATKPRPIDPDLAEQYIEAYDNITFNDESCMLYSTLDHVHTVKNMHARALAAESRADALEGRGITLPEETEAELITMQQEIFRNRATIYRLQNRTLWQRITNQMV